MRPQGLEQFGGDYSAGLFLARLGSEDVEDLLGVGRVRYLPRGSTLETESAVSARIVVLLAGAVKLCHYAAHGRELILALVGPGDVIGQPLTPVPQPAPATAITVTDVELLAIPYGEAVRFLDAHAHVRDVFVATLVCWSGNPHPPWSGGISLGTTTSPAAQNGGSRLRFRR